MSGRAALLIGLWLGMTFVYLLSPVFEVDAFWQIRLGQLMQERRGLITHDPFTYTHAGQPVPTIGWLAQLFLASVFGIGGWPLVHFLNALLLAGSFAIAGWSSLSGAGGPRATPVAAAAAATLGFLVTLSNSDVRPQTIGVACFALFLHVCGSALAWPRRLLALGLILLVWQNSHPSVSLAIAASLALAVGAAIERRRGGAARAAAPYVAGLGLALVSQLATPMGVGIFAVSAKNVEVSRGWLRISEWLPPWNETVVGSMQMFWVALALSVVLSARVGMRRRLELTDTLLFAAMSAMALTAARFGLFWALAMVSVWAHWLAQASSHRLLRWQGEGVIPLRRWLPAGAVGLVLLIALPPFLRGPVLHRELPTRGVEALKSVLAAGRIYSAREWGGPLILAGAPPWQVSIDGRLYVFDRPEWIEYGKAVRGELPLEELIARHNPDAFFLAPHQRGLVSQLKAATGWRELHSDASSVVFVRAP